MKRQLLAAGVAGAAGVDVVVDEPESELLVSVLVSDFDSDLDSLLDELDPPEEPLDDE